MTVRELMQRLLLEAPDLNADVYINKKLDDIEYKDYSVVEIASHGSSDAIFIELEDWHQ